jgi:hypothetical protein
MRCALHTEKTPLVRMYVRTRMYEVCVHQNVNPLTPNDL